MPIICPACVLNGHFNRTIVELKQSSAVSAMLPYFAF